MVTYFIMITIKRRAGWKTTDVKSIYSERDVTDCLKSRDYNKIERQPLWTQLNNNPFLSLWHTMLQNRLCILITSSRKAVHHHANPCKVYDISIEILEEIKNAAEFKTRPFWNPVIVFVWTRVIPAILIRNEIKAEQTHSDTHVLGMACFWSIGANRLPFSRRENVFNLYEFHLPFFTLLALFESIYKLLSSWTLLHANSPVNRIGGSKRE